MLQLWTHAQSSMPICLLFGLLGMLQWLLLLSFDFSWCCSTSGSRLALELATMERTILCCSSCYYQALAAVSGVCWWWAHLQLVLSYLSTPNGRTLALDNRDTDSTPFQTFLGKSWLDECIIRKFDWIIFKSLLWVNDQLFIFQVLSISFADVISRDTTVYY